MQIKTIDFGFSTADAEDVVLHFNGSDLLLQFTDWKEQPQEWTFKNVLAYQWGQTSEIDLPENDCTYEIHGSDWLVRETREAGSGGAAKTAHYALCFNACGILEVIADLST